MQSSADVSLDDAANEAPVTDLEAKQLKQSYNEALHKLFDDMAQETLDKCVVFFRYDEINFY